MKLLIDECLPRQLKRLLPEHDVKNVREMRWGGKDDGTLLRLAAHDFDVFITVDQNLEYQQNLKNVNIAIAVFKAKSNRIEDIEPLVPKLKEVLQTIQPKDYIEIRKEEAE